MWIGIRSRRRRVWLGGEVEGRGGRREEADEAEKVTASIDFSRQQRKVEPPQKWSVALLQACPFAGRQFTASFAPISLPVTLQIASPQTIQVDDDAAGSSDGGILRVARNEGGRVTQHTRQSTLTRSMTRGYRDYEWLKIEE